MRFGVRRIYVSGTDRRRKDIPDVDDVLLGQNTYDLSLSCTACFADGCCVKQLDTAL